MMTPPDLATLLVTHRYVYATPGEDAIGAYRGDREPAIRDARRMCHKLAMPVLSYEDGECAGQLTPVGGRAMWTSEGRAA